jgi:hypothetical protein
MSETSIYIKKYSGELELFSFQKLKKSLERSGASEEAINSIIKTISPQ